MENLRQLADLLKERNMIDAMISEIISRPAQQGHLGEFIASKIFDVSLNSNANQKGIDGVFNSGPLEGQTVNIKYYGKRENILDINPKGVPDYYLVLTGPKVQSASSRGQTRPFIIANIYLFDAQPLITTLQSRGIHIGIATSVINELWDRAEIYPSSSSNLPIDDHRRNMIALFKQKNE